MSTAESSEKAATPRRGTLLPNAVVSLLNFGLSLLIGVFFTPYVLHRLGPALYGLIPLTLTIVSYLSVATGGLEIVVSRFVTVALARNDTEGANRTFNTAMFSLWGVGLLLIVPLAVAVGFADSLVQVPGEHVADLRLLFVCVACSFLLTTSTGSFGVAFFFRNRLDLQGGLAFAANLLRVGIVIVCFSLLEPRLLHVGLGMCAAAGLTLVGNVFALRHLTPELRLRSSSWSWAELRRVFGSVWWLVLNHVGTILLIGIDLLVVNRVFGAVAGTRYALALQWSILLRGVASTLGGLLAPDITVLYAKGDTQALVAYTRKAVRLLALVLALPIGLISGFGKPLLTVWVGADYAGLAPLMAVLTIPLAVNLAYMPLHNISMASNRVRVPGLVQIAAGGLNLVLAVGLARYSSLGLYGVALAGGLVLTLRNIVFTPLYAAHILEVRWHAFLREVLPSAGTTLGVAAVCWLVSRFVPIATWGALIVAGAGVALLYGVVVYTLLLGPAERAELAKRLGLGGRGLHPLPE